jgi:hypothetical protein
MNAFGGRLSGSKSTEDVARVPPEPADIRPPPPRDDEQGDHAIDRLESQKISESGESQENVLPRALAI